MTEYLVSVKTLLGDYYPGLRVSSQRSKYKHTALETFFEQRFLIQSNRTQMIVNPNMSGLTMVVSGNEVYVSQLLYDHPSINITNSAEKLDTAVDTSRYTPAVFSTIAYLVCKNQITLNIVNNLEEPIYITYKSFYETFYNSVISIDIVDSVDIEIVEEFESFSALNAVTNYTLAPYAKLHLSTFYKNHLTALSFCYRNIDAQDNSVVKHDVFANGGSNTIDENRIKLGVNALAEFNGIVNSRGKHFHSILHTALTSVDSNVSVNYKNILEGDADVTFLPMVSSTGYTEAASVNISDINLDETPIADTASQLTNFINDIVSNSYLTITNTGAVRYYKNKADYINKL